MKRYIYPLLDSYLHKKKRKKKEACSFQFLARIDVFLKRA